MDRRIFLKKSAVLAFGLTALLTGCEKEKVEELETLTGNAVNVNANCYGRGREGTLSTTLEIDDKLILATGKGYCNEVTRAATVIDTAIKRGDKIELVVCNSDVGYYIHRVTAEGYAINFSK